MRQRKQVPNRRLTRADPVPAVMQDKRHDTPTVLKEGLHGEFTTGMGEGYWAADLLMAGGDTNTRLRVSGFDSKACESIH